MEKVGSEYRMKAPVVEKTPKVAEVAPTVVVTAASSPAAPVTAPAAKPATSALASSTANQKAAPAAVEKAPETQILTPIQKSVKEFNDYLKSVNLAGRIVQDSEKARWVDTKKNDFSLVIGKNLEVKTYVNWSLISRNSELSDFEKSLAQELAKIVAKNKSKPETK